MALNPIADAIVRMEGADDPKSINMALVRQYGLWNVGHLVWADQYGATKVWMGDRDWAGWPTREDAYAGLLRDLAAKARVGHTIESAMRKYAPAKENNTENYIQYIVAQTGYPRTTPLSSILAGTITPITGNTPTPAGMDPLFLTDETTGESLFDTMGEDTKIMIASAAAAAALFMALAMMKQ